MKIKKEDKLKYIKLSHCEKFIVEALEQYYLLIIGMTKSENDIFIRLYINNNYVYENLFQTKYPKEKYNELLIIKYL